VSLENGGGANIVGTTLTFEEDILAEKYTFGKWEISIQRTNKHSRGDDVQ
jgi:uncharacterized sporulation protein YeaH/YhbH (DUF444 family)